MNKTDYTKKSDREIDLMVAEALGYKTGYGWISDADGLYTYIVDPTKTGEEYRDSLPYYCSNPHDAWPIILKIKRLLTKQPHHWYVTKKPFRYAMIAFLKSKEDQHVRN